MGNDTQFLEVQDLPFRLIQIPTGSAPPPPSPHIHRKRHAPPAPPSRFDGYDAPPSLPPPPLTKKHSDELTPCVPGRSDLPQSHSTKIILQNPSNKIKYHRKQIPKRQSSCCTIC